LSSRWPPSPRRWWPWAAPPEPVDRFAERPPGWPPWIPKPGLSVAAMMFIGLLVVAACGAVVSIVVAVVRLFAQVE
jgi:hypothetical protein